MRPVDDLDLQELEDFDVHSLFCHYNRLYFDDQLGACSVQWSSSRMTLCVNVLLPPHTLLALFCHFGAGRMVKHCSQ